MAQADDRPAQRAKALKGRAWIAYLAVAGVASLLYAFGPVLQGNGPLFNAISGSSAIAILVGIRIHRPAAIWMWRWLAIGQGLFFLGDVYTYSYPVLIGHDVPFPSLGDAFYVLVYPALMIGILIAARRRNPQGDRAGVIDALIITIGIALLSWVFLIAPYVHDATLTPLAKAVSIAYPLGDVLLLAGALRLAFGGGRHRSSFFLLTVAVATLLTTDAAYGYALLNGTFRHQVIYDLGWLAFYLLWGASALHPSMRKFGEATPDRERRLSWQRLGLLTAAAVVAPTIELIKEARQGDYDTVLVVAASMVVVLLVVARVLGLVSQHERTARRERLLGMANLDLVKAATPDAIGAVGLETAQLLVGNMGDARLCVQVPGGLVLVTTPGAEQRSLPSWTVELLEEGALDPSARTELPAGAQGDLELSFGSGYANVFPLAVRGDRRGVLVAAAPDPFSPLLISALDALCASVSLALESAALADQVLEHQAFHDAVTGLPNRALFANRVDLALASAHREQSAAAVICLDLDDFKAINDGFGYASGDEVLRTVAERLLAIVAPDDTAARFGGDEFAILVEDVGDPETVIDLAERLVRAFEQPISVGARDLTIRPSFGLAISHAGARQTAVGADDLIRNADAAMHISKREGKGGYRIFERAMFDRVRERLELRVELQRAIDFAEFEVHYQPIVGLEDGHAMGMEALVRWHHPTRGFVQPEAFIPLAEEMGLIVELGRWVLGEACRHVMQLREAGDVGEEFDLNVNLSVKQLQDARVVEDVHAALESSGFPPARLVLEITETVMMADYAFASTRLQELKDLGVRIAMDDFGAGYSSLGYLSRLPVDVLKMDRSFLAEHDAFSVSALAAAIVGLGGNLGLRVIAEGIESLAQYEALCELGCPLGQGFYIARPMDFATTRDWLATLERRWRLAA